MKHWHIEQVAWGRFEPAKVDPEIVPLVKAAAMVEKNGGDYALYLNGVFHDDPDFRRAADNWAMEEIQHGDALGRWAMLADPSWRFAPAFARYRAGFRISTEADASIRGSRTGELIARCMVETGTSSYRFRHVERGMGMVFKSVGLTPRGRLSALAAKGAWRLLQRRRRRFQRRTALGAP